MQLLHLSEEELHRAQAEELERRDQQLLHGQLLQQNLGLREAHEKSLNEMEALKKIPEAPPSILLQDEDLSRIRTLFWNFQAEIQELQNEINCIE